jgi:hypothetical protein
VSYICLELVFIGVNTQLHDIPPPLRGEDMVNRFGL